MSSMKGTFSGVIASLERSGKLDGIETGDKLICSECKRITFTGRGAREFNICYVKTHDELVCTGTLGRKDAETNTA